MIRHRILLISSLFLLAGISTSLAGERTEREMLSIAQAKLQGKGAQTRSALDITKLAEERLYCVYGNDTQGFVIVSRNDDCTPIIGYSDRPYHADNLPCGLKWWLQTVSHNIEQGVDGRHAATREIAFTEVAPFVKTQWGQGAPYNLLTPELNGKHTPTGCVATAMAQVMKYYNYPAQGKGKGYYTTTENSTRVTEQIKGEYQWGLMMDKYNASATDEQKLAVATLMKDAGLSTNMTYGSGGSAASEIVAAHGMAYNFRYDSLALKAYERDFFDRTEWLETVYSQLEAKKPLLYVGASGTNGHAFILDGIDSDGLVHVNWGWNGDEDGFYNIDLLNPEKYAYSTQQGMVFDFKCQEEPDSDEEYYSLWYAYDAPYDMSLNGKILKVKHDGIYNFHFLYFVGDIVVYAQPRNGDNTEGKVVRLSSSTNIYTTYYGLTANENSVFLTSIPSGDYLLYIATKSILEKDYQPVRCPGGPICYELTVDEDGKLTLSDKPKYLSEYDTSTAIQSVSVNGRQKSGRIYDLLGRKVSTSENTLPHGIYIIDGNKVIK